MPKTEFLKHFQRNLRDAIEELVVDKWECEELLVSVEDGYLDGKFNGYIDISITDCRENKKIIAIEIEHKSGPEPARKNIEKMKTWTHNSQDRICGFLHILNEDCKISRDQLSSLVRFAKDNERKDCGFYYDFIFYRVNDLKKTRTTAYDLVQTKDFQTRLWMLMEDAQIV